MQNELTVLAPGRVNLLGEHIDYNDGMVLPVAIDRSVRLSFKPLAEPQVFLHAEDFDAHVIFDFDSINEKNDIFGKKLPAWAIYPAGVAWALHQNGLGLPGMAGNYSSNIPIGAGLSSSAAVEVAFAFAWQTLGNWSMDRMTLARICQQAEIHYVGVNSGLMDQFASSHGVAGHALVFDTRNQEWYPVPLPDSISIVIADSGVRRSLTNSAYNERHAACQQALAILRQVFPGILALRDVTPGQLYDHKDLLPGNLYKRAQHVVEECARVEKAVLLLNKADIAGFGELMYAGHRSLRDLYEVSCPELDRLVEIAGSLPGCLGARLTGAGFGGCTVNLVEETAASSFTERLKEKYAQATGGQAQVYTCKASEGVHLT
jgi:galactokinase